MHILYNPYYLSSLFLDFHVYQLNIIIPEIIVQIERQNMFILFNTRPAINTQKFATVSIMCLISND